MTHAAPDQVIYGHNDMTSREAANAHVGRWIHVWDSYVLTHALVGTDKSLYETPLALLGNQLHVVLDLEAVGGSEAGDHLDLYVDASIDEGASWYNVVHFTQLDGNNAVPKKYIAVTMASPTAAGSYDEVSANLAAGAAPRHFVGNRIRVRGTTADLDADASWTVSLSMAVN